MILVNNAEGFTAYVPLFYWFSSTSSVILLG